MIPQHERRILEAHVRGVPLTALALQERPLNEYEERELKNLIKMRMKGFPIQYLTGVQGFYGRDFYVNTGVLIPRPETEGLVERALALLPERSPRPLGEKLRGLDFGTGSGCIALTIALERSDVTMIASDASSDALEVAEENASRMRVGNVDFLHVSEEPQLWQYEVLAELDFVVSNPPYLVGSDEIAMDVREHEPPEALFVREEEPFYFYRFLAELLDAHLRPGGFAVLEIAEQRGKETAEIFSAKGYSTEVQQDLPGRDRYLIVKRPT